MPLWWFAFVSKAEEGHTDLSAVYVGKVKRIICYQSRFTSGQVEQKNGVSEVLTLFIAEKQLLSLNRAAVLVRIGGG